MCLFQRIGVPKLCCPNTNHTPEWDQYSHDVGDDKHRLRRDLPVPLDVPEAERADGGRDCLRQAQVRVLQERELELVILADRYEGPGGVQTLHICALVAADNEMSNEGHARQPARRTRPGTRKCKEASCIALERSKSVSTQS